MCGRMCFYAHVQVLKGFERTSGCEFEVCQQSMRHNWMHETCYAFTSRGRDYLKNSASEGTRSILPTHG